MCAWDRPTYIIHRRTDTVSARFFGDKDVEQSPNGGMSTYVNGLAIRAVVYAAVSLQTDSECTATKMMITTMAK